MEVLTLLLLTIALWGAIFYPGMWLIRKIVPDETSEELEFSRWLDTVEPQDFEEASWK